MHREIHHWYSPNLNKEMPIVMYGHYGFSLLLLPTAAADYLEYERFLMIQSLKPHIEAGKVKVFSVNSINAESWLNNGMYPPHKAIRHNQFNEYVYNEVIPFIKSKTSYDTPIYVTGASLGALHSANLYFKRPDLIDGVIAMSGVYDLTTYTRGYWDEQVYFNSPVHYLPNLGDDYYLPKLQYANHIHILSGAGNYERPDASHQLSGILNSKGIPHELDIWGADMPHDWPTWRDMLPYYIASRF
ncbi:MAG: esterase family protein [Saprospiraceae bacterium]|nr:esterase family protein [Saprospiraceae bacterium]MCB9319316.1 esterase family protein [Lewinellaceae bacterium]